MEKRLRCLRDFKEAKGQSCHCPLSELLPVFLRPGVRSSCRECVLVPEKSARTNSESVEGTGNKTCEYLVWPKGLHDNVQKAGSSIITFVDLSERSQSMYHLAKCRREKQPRRVGIRVNSTHTRDKWKQKRERGSSSFPFLLTPGSYLHRDRGQAAPILDNPGATRFSMEGGCQGQRKKEEGMDSMGGYYSFRETLIYVYTIKKKSYF